MVASMHLLTCARTGKPSLRFSGAALLLLLVASCNYGWDALDPRLGDTPSAAEGGGGDAVGGDGGGGSGGAAGGGGDSGSDGRGGSGGSQRDASTGDANRDSSVVDSGQDRSQMPDVTDAHPVTDAPADAPADVVPDGPPVVCTGSMCPLCIEIVYQSACCKTDGTCGCMTNIPPGPCK